MVFPVKELPMHIPLRWDEMSVSTCPAIIPWSSTWADMVEHLKSMKIDRLLAWGDSTGRGKCRLESAEREIPAGGRTTDQLAQDVLAIFRDIVKPNAEERMRFMSDSREWSFFSAGRSRFDFNASIDLCDGIDIRLVVHLSADCGSVYMFAVSPVPTPLAEPVGFRPHPLPQSVKTVTVRSSGRRRAKPLSEKNG